jgi:hypothetical protein
MQDDFDERTQPGFFSLNDWHLFQELNDRKLNETSGHTAFNLMRMINTKTNALRSSLIHCHSETIGYVIASNDNEKIKGLKLNLLNYPEIGEVRQRKKTLVVADVRTSDLMADVRDRINQTPFETIVVFPIEQNGEFYGVLNLRMKQKSPIELSFIETLGVSCAQLISLSSGLSSVP